MKRYLSWLILPLALTGCDALTSHTNVVARVEEHELAIDEMAEMLAMNPQVPARTEVVGTVADLWVDYTLLTKALAADTALTDLDLSSMMDPFVEQRTFEQLREQVLTTDTVFSEEELRAAFADEGPGTRIRARHVLLSYPEGADEAARDSLQQLAEEIRERAEAGEDFAALAREYSQDPGSAQEGGSLGWFERGQMVRPFEEAAFALEPGEVSEVVESPFGLHIIKLEERETQAWDPEQGDRFRRQLVQQRRQASLTAYVDSLRSPEELEIEAGAAEVVRNLAEDPGKSMNSRAGSRELITWDDGAVTALELARLYRRLPPPQLNQYASMQDEQAETLLRELATNEIVLADARARGISVPEEEQDSLERLIRTELLTVARDANLLGAPQEGETESQAVERRVRTLLESVLTGQRNMMPLGSVPFMLREQMEWQIHESTFSEVVEEIEERRSDPAMQQPAPPTGGAMPQGGGTPPAQPPAPPSDTGG